MMTPGGPHHPEQLVRYAENDLPATERSAVAQHVAFCPPCRDFLAFIIEFTAAMRDARPSVAAPSEACPDASLIVDLVSGELDHPTAEHVRAHVAFCTHCLEEVFLLKQARISEQPEQGVWEALLQRLSAFVIDLGKTYGPGTVLGPVRVVAEAPAFATRGDEAPERVFKVMDVALGDHTCSVELGVTPDGSLQCDVAGIGTSDEIPVTVEVRSGSGELLAREEADLQGNAVLAVSGAQLADDVCVVTFLLFDWRCDMLVRLLRPARPSASA